jgi:inosine/xanthosine triphosphatase
MNIIVASQNPVKMASTETGFQRIFPEQSFTMEGVSVPSGVSEQPMSNEETLRGARNRVLEAWRARPEADYWVGIEGGIIEENGQMETFAWIVVEGKDGRGEARTAGFYLPPAVARLVAEGHELGHADDIVFGASNSKQKNGALGLLTADRLTRTELYVPAVMMALIPFLNPSLYFSDAD